MTGYDSSEDKSPTSIALIALAAFSASYNLPVYLHYNNTFRRAYRRMLRCQSGPNSDTLPTVTTRQATAVNTGRDQAGVSKVSDEPCTSSRVNDREQQDNKETEPSTSQQRYISRTSVVTQPLAVMWERGPNTKPLDA